ncbi:endolysin [Bacillus phage VMY22]|uniref:Endolysin n=1 Tax=Bacillus phage VMY22 TaxID=1734382 RepID=A0A0N9SGQ7_9CAUD|nr:endolysin [Bacillus phage VMY22]ALH46485.1 endolysin [Bacillus phage VMY22]
MKARDMSVSDNGVNFVKSFEGYFQDAYWDKWGSVWTIGYGHTKGVKRGDRLENEREAHNILKRDLDSHMIIPKQDITSNLSQSQYDALTSFAFNLGASIFRNNRNLLDAINSSNWNEASRIMKLFNRAGGQVLPGLTRRRNAEADMMLKTDEGQPTATETYDSSWFTKETGVFKLDSNIKLRTAPFTGATVLATLPIDSLVNYDAYGIEQDGFVWIRQPRSNGYGYLATGETRNGKRIDTWGSFK